MCSILLIVGKTVRTIDVVSYGSLTDRNSSQLCISIFFNDRSTFDSFLPTLLRLKREMFATKHFAAHDHPSVKQKKLENFKGIAERGKYRSLPPGQVRKRDRTAVVPRRVVSTVRCSAYKSTPSLDRRMGDTGRRHVNTHKQTLRILTDKRLKQRATSYSIALSLQITFYSSTRFSPSNHSNFSLAPIIFRVIYFF